MRHYVSFTLIQRAIRHDTMAYHVKNKLYLLHLSTKYANFAL